MEDWNFMFVKFNKTSYWPNYASQIREAQFRYGYYGDGRKMISPNDQGK